MNHQVFERTWHSSEYACFSVVTPSPRREPCGGPWASWGLAASSPASPRGGCRQHIHPRRPKRASFPRASLDSLPRPASCGALLTCASCRRRVCPCGIGARRQRTGGPRGVVGEPESLNKARGRFNNPRVRSPPASFATAHQQSVGTQAMRALGPGREGLTALAPAPTTPFVL